MKSYFQLTRKDKIGIVAVSSIILVFVVLLNVNQHRGLEDPTYNAEMIPLNQNDDSALDQTESHSSEFVETSGVDYFDPNQISQTEWEGLGFSEKQAVSIVNYRQKYGAFESAQDVCKLYVVSDKKCQELSPYMLFEDEVDSANPDVRVSNFESIEINSASSEELQKIKGIGPAYAERIIKFRNSLGGFCSKDQYAEVYGLMDESLNALEQNTHIDQQKIEKININKASKSEIKKHPYLRDFKVVAKILEKREEQQLTSLNFLVEEKVMNQNDLDKLLPYIEFNK